MIEPVPKASRAKKYGKISQNISRMANEKSAEGAKDHADCNLNRPARKKDTDDLDKLQQKRKRDAANAAKPTNIGDDLLLIAMFQNVDETGQDCVEREENDGKNDYKCEYKRQNPQSVAFS